MSLFRGQSAVNFDVILDLRKEAFSAVSCFWYLRIIQKVEHILQSIKQHVTSSFQIAHYPATTFVKTDSLTVAFFPKKHIVDEHLLVFVIIG